MTVVPRIFSFLTGACVLLATTSALAQSAPAQPPGAANNSNTPAQPPGAANNSNTPAQPPGAGADSNTAAQPPLVSPAGAANAGPPTVSFADPQEATPASAAAQPVEAAQQPRPAAVASRDAVAKAEPKPSDPNPIDVTEQAEQVEAKPRRLALGLSLLKEHGFGGLFRVRFNHVALDAAGGFMPVLIVTQNVSGTKTDIDGALPLHASAGPVFFFSDHYKRFQNGIRINGIYDQLMGPGGGLGWVGELTKTSFTLAFGAGLQIYPEAERRIRDHFDYPYSVELDPTSTVVQLYAGLNLFWYVI